MANTLQSNPPREGNQSRSDEIQFTFGKSSAGHSHGCTPTEWVQFPQLTRTQKDSARLLYNATREREQAYNATLHPDEEPLEPSPPLLLCWFSPRGHLVSHELFSIRNPNLYSVQL